MKDVLAAIGLFFVFCCAITSFSVMRRRGGLPDLQQELGEASMLLFGLCLLVLVGLTLDLTIGGVLRLLVPR